MSLTPEEFQRRLSCVLGEDDMPSTEPKSTPLRTAASASDSHMTEPPEPASSVPPNTSALHWGYESGDESDEHVQPDFVTKRTASTLPERLKTDNAPVANPTSKRPSYTADSTGFEGEQSKMPVGSLAEPGEAFCPIIAISKYPYKFVRNHELGQRIASEFFDNAKFWRYQWKIYYAWPPFSVSPKPLLLVPARQVEILIATMNKVLRGRVPSLSAVSREHDLTLTFDNSHPDLRPRFLGVSFSQAQFRNLESNVPGLNSRVAGETPSTRPPSDEALSHFTRQLERGVGLCHARKATRVARNEQRISYQRDWFNDLRQTEKFLGLRAHLPEDSGPSEQTWEESQAREKAYEAAKHPPALSFAAKPPHLFPPIIFISIDVESYEQDKSKITEVGISTFDNGDINEPPGEYAVNWRQHIRARHFRIKEHAHLNNSDFVQGCAGDFKFGESEFVSLEEAPKVIATCFRPPFSGTKEYDESVTRKIVLVGHDFSNDIRYLERLGYAVQNLSSLHPTHPVIDTQALYRAHTRNRDPESLGNVLAGMEITPWSLHNAGNDAAYTMQAMLAIAVKSAGERDSRPAKRRTEESGKSIVAEATTIAAHTAMNDQEIWNNRSETEDGGVQLHPKAGL